MSASILMRRDLSGPLPRPVWPPGIMLAPFAETDAAAAHALMRLAYAQGGGTVTPSFEEWWLATSADDEFDPALCMIAKAADGRVVGFALCWTTSFVKDLVVHPDYRRRGIGQALLLAAAAAFKERGSTQVGLRVEASNPSGARRLYERLGFVIG